MRAAALAAAGAVTRTRKRPSMLHVPPATAAPGSFATGRLSPVSADSSTPPDAVDDDAVGRERRRPAPTATTSPGASVGRRDALARRRRATRVARRRRRGERGAHRGAGLGPRARLEIAAERHQDEQHRGGVEVDRRAGPRTVFATESPYAAPVPSDDERVGVRRAGAQRRQRAGEDRPAEEERARARRSTSARTRSTTEERAVGAVARRTRTGRRSACSAS